MQKVYILEAQDPKSQAWTELERIQIETSHELLQKGKQALTTANESKPGWLLRWRVER